MANKVDLKFLSLDLQNLSITIAINGVRYEYFWKDGDMSKRWYNYKKQAIFKPGATLNAIKTSAWRYDKLDKEKINEKYEKYEGKSNYGIFEVDLYENPSVKEFDAATKKSKYGQTRFIVSDTKILLWPAEQCLHYNIDQEFFKNNTKSLEMGYTTQGTTNDQIEISGVTPYGFKRLLNNRLFMRMLKGKKVETYV